MAAAKARRKILVVEDDPSIAFGLSETLRGEHYEVVLCTHGNEALTSVRRERPSLVLLDVMLPGKSGFDVLEELRHAGVGVPVILLTARGQEIDKVVGLKLGADDYVTKPFGVQELLARIAAVLRRTGSEDAALPPPLPAEIAFGEVRIDTAALRGMKGRTRFDLTPREMTVLGILVREAGRVVSRDRLLEEAWGKTYYGTTRTLDQVILKLRQKLETRPGEPRFLLTVHGLGYRFEP